jgi:hypothetical protein
MSDIFREVDEEVRRDQAVQLWEKYQSLIIAAAILVVVATGAWKVYDAYRTRAADAAGAQYEAALQLAREGKNDNSRKAFAAIAADAPLGYRTLALFRVAGETGVRDPAAGAKEFDALAAAAETPSLMQEVARMRAAILRLDGADMSEMKARLEPLTQPGKPFRNTARELLGLAALKANDVELAGRMFDQIVLDPQATSTQRQRVEAMLGLVQAGKSPPKAP